MCIVRIKETVDRTCDTVDLAESSDTEKSDTDAEKCKKLRKVKIGAYVTNIGSRCFYKCSNLTSVTFSGKKAPKIENQAFKKTRAKAKRTKEMSNKQFNLLKKRVNNAKW